MPDSLSVFLCHASNDKPVVRNLFRFLESVGGVSPWLDEVSLLPGQDWQLEIKKAVHESDVVIVCLSKSSINKKGFTQKEIKFALDVADEQPEGSIYIIPAFLEECELPDRLSKYQFVRLYEVGGLDRLFAALQHRADDLGLSISLPSAPTTDENLKLLAKALSHKNWREADQLTALVMLQIAKREKSGFLSPSDFEQFPCSILLTIDDLWVEASDNRFGFSIQADIWKRIGGKRNVDISLYKSFGIQIGWEDVQKEKWLPWGELDFSLNAPAGHLPTPPRWWELWEGFRVGEDSLYYRLEECKGM